MVRAVVGLTWGPIRPCLFEEQPRPNRWFNYAPGWSDGEPDALGFIGRSRFGLPPVEVGMTLLITHTG